MRGAPDDQERVRSWTVPAGQRDIRVDLFLRRCIPQLSLRQLRKAIDAGAFSLGNERARKGRRISAGDVLTFRGAADLLAAAPIPQSHLDVPILYEDESILLVDKPAGMAVHGFSGGATCTLANFLAAERPSLVGVGRNRWEPGLIHRLDRDTSGIVLIAKDQDAFKNLRDQFRRQTVQKRYWALVRGRTRRAGVIAYPLTHDVKDRRKMKILRSQKSGRAGSKAWPAITRFRTLGCSRGFSFLWVQIDTGVTHQIRAHLASAGHPIVGDTLYGEDKSALTGVSRQFLHAFYLGFRHPKDGREVGFECPLPQALQSILNRLKIEL